MAKDKDAQVTISYTKIQKHYWLKYITKISYHQND